MTVSLKSTITQELRQRIIDGRYALGQRLSENLLSREMNTSRSPVHDALMTLKSEGLINVFPQRGSFVFNPTHREIAALFELSGIYEMGALALLSHKSIDKLCKKLDQTIELIDESISKRDPLILFRADRTFHESIVKFSGNALLTNSYQILAARLAALVYRQPYDPQRVQRTKSQHLDILAHIRQGDLDGAGKRLLENNLTMK